MIPRLLPPAARLAAATLGVAVATLLTWIFRGQLGPTPLVFFYMATILSAWLGGLVPGLTAAILSAAAAKQVLGWPTALTPVPGSATFVWVILSITAAFVGTLAAGQRRSRHRLEDTLASTPDAILTVDDRAQITFLNPASQGLTGWSRRVARRRPVTEVVSLTDEAGDATPLPVLEVLSDGETRTLPPGVVLSTRDGRLVPVAGSVAPVRDARGRVTGGVVVLRDETERRATEHERAGLAREVSAGRERLERLLAEVPAVVWEASGSPAGQRLTFISRHIETLSGYTVEECLSTPDFWAQRLHPEDREQVWRAAQEAFAGRGSGVTQFRLLAKDGRTLWFESLSFAMRDADGRPIGMRGVAIEVSERLQAERDRSELLTREQEARRAAEEANRLKDEFLMTLSHELRTPLNAILGWACLLRDSRLDAEKQARAIETIERNARAQTQLIEGLLDMSRIITGKVRLELGPVSLTTTASAVVDSMRPAAEAKGIRLELAADPDVEAVPGDGDRLQQVVWNLVSNAIKFTPDGGRVQVRIRQLYDRVMLAVSDSGQGVKAEELPHIFDRFRQGERAQGGLGLGLAIVRSLVEMHGGSVEARSLGENLGATFVVRLPMFATPVHRAEVASATPVGEGAPALRGQLGGLRVLIVDDAPDARELAQVMLEQAGASVRLASTAQEALAALDAFQPQAIVSDLFMPGTNGFELIREIRAREAASGRPAVPAVALSAYARPEDRRAALDAGYHLHLAKPVGAHDLSAALAALAATATA